MPRAGAVAVAAALALLAGCGGGEEPDADLTTLLDAVPTTEPTSTTLLVASVQDYAAIVAEHGRELPALVAAGRACLEPSLSTAPERCDIDAEVALLTATIQADLVATVLGSAADDRPENGSYVGRPPPEIAELVARTATTAAEVHRIAQECPGPLQAAGCQVQNLQVAEVFTRLVTALEEWTPYL